MKLTPMDISSKEFKKAIRGYEQNEVEEFLDKIAEDYEALYKENSALRDKVTSITERLEHYSKMETTIQNTLLLAQNSAEQAKKNAQKEAEMIINSANESAKRILDKAHQEVVHINDDYERLKHEFNKFRSQFKIFMKTQMDTFEGVEREFFKSYSIGSTIQESIKEKDIQKTEEEFNYESIKSSGVREFKVTNAGDEDFSENPVNEIKNFFVK